MSKIATIQTQVEFELKQNVEDILQHLGLTTTQAITLFLEHIALQKDLPFEVKKPNAETRAALEEASQPEKLESYKTPEAFFEQKIMESANKVYANAESTLESGLVLMQNNSIDKENW